jgi:hypothetical protein
MKRITEPAGIRVWFPIFGSIAAWMAHLTAVSALARRTCLTGQDWVIHATTIGLAAVTIFGMVVAAGLRAPAVVGRDGQPRSELLFLGKMGLLVSAINLLLILFEGSLVFWIPTC